MFCSVIIPTIGRETLSRTVQSVLTQKPFPGEFEVIVVNDSGRALPPALWQADHRIRLKHTKKRKLCVARNTGAAAARGEYLLFLDDDDWLAANALAHFWQLAHENDHPAALFGNFELVDNNGSILSRHGLRRSGNCSIQLVSGLWIQVAAVLLRADVFFALGGFSPQFSTSEEIDLFNRVSLHHDIFSMDNVVAQVLRGEGWQTTVNYALVYENNRYARDIALSHPGALYRLWQSVENGYWYGRFFRLYATTMFWNLFRKRKYFTALSRGFWAMAAFLLAGRHIFTRQYWHGVHDTVPQM